MTTPIRVQDQDYRKLALRYRKVLDALEKKSAARSARVQDELARLAKDHQRVRDVDFFDAPGGVYATTPRKG